MNELVLLLIGVVCSVLIIGFYFYDDVIDYYKYVIPMKSALFDNLGHYDYLPLTDNPNMMSMEEIKLNENDDSILVRFGQNNYTLSSGYKPIPDFHMTKIFNINDVFAILCTNLGKDGYTSPGLSEPYYPTLGIVKYLGTNEVEGEKVFVFWHESILLQTDMGCNYPKMIEYSINLWDLNIIQDD